MKVMRATWVLAATITLATAAQARDVATQPTSPSDAVGETGQMLSYNQPDHQKMMEMMRQMMKRMQSSAMNSPSSSTPHTNPDDPLNDRSRERH